MGHRYCIIFDTTSESGERLVDSVKAWNIFGKLDLYADVTLMRSALKTQIMNDDTEEAFLLLGSTTQEQDVYGLLKSFSKAMSAKLKVILLRDAESSTISPDLQNQAEVVVIDDPAFSSLRVRLTEIIAELDASKNVEATQDNSNEPNPHGVRAASDVNSFTSPAFALQVMKTVQRLEILLWSQGGAKLEDKIIPRFIIGKLSRELVESFNQNDITNDFRKHFETVVIEWNRSLKKTSLEIARESLVKQVLSFHAFSPEIRMRFSGSPEPAIRAKAPQATQTSSEVTSDTKSNDEHTDSLASAIGQSFSELDNFWNELWKGVDKSDVSATAEALLEKRVRQFVLKLLGNFVENEIIREFRMYFEKHMMQWYKDARTMPQEQSSALLRKRILSFPGLPSKLSTEDPEDSTEAANIAEVMTQIVASFGELVPLFEKGAFKLDPSGQPTSETREVVTDFVARVFASAPKTIRLEEFRAYFYAAVEKWASIAQIEGISNANAHLRTQLQNFYKKI